MIQRRALFSTGFLLMMLPLSACVTKKYVKQEVATARTELSTRIDEEASRRSDLGNQVQELSSLNKKNSSRITELDANINNAVKTMEPKIEDAKKTGVEAQGTANTALETSKSNAATIANLNDYSRTVLASDVFFKTGSAALDDKAQEVLQSAAKTMTADKDVVLELRGYTDSTGDPQYNLQLSNRRVESVIRYLAGPMKLDLHRIYSLGLGMENPVDDNKTAVGRAKNRRVSLAILGLK
jgi:outer membrane protein OmpA-like peptidoglycan-associated protein